MSTIVTNLAGPSGPLINARLVDNLRGAAYLAVATLIIGGLIAAFASPFVIRLTATAFINVIVVVGLQVFMGNSNIVNIGHAAFMALGAYITAIFATPVAMKMVVIPHAPFGISISA